MRGIVFKADLFSSERDRARSQRVLLLLLGALAESDQIWLEQHPKAPLLYRSGVRYRREEGTEEWRGIDEVLQTGYGDCEDLACWRVAELRLKGIAARPFLSWKRRGNFFLYHVRVLWPNGKIEDPSALLGMHESETEA